MTGDPAWGAEPVDPDVDLRVDAQRTELAHAHVSVLGAIGLGGGVGAVARYGLAVWLPAGPGGFPWATFTVNVLGCFLIGVLMVVIARRRAHRLVRPFLGVGVLGGFTTFSAYAAEFHELVTGGFVLVGLAYLTTTLLAAGLAVLAGTVVTRRLGRTVPVGRPA